MKNLSAVLLTFLCLTAHATPEQPTLPENPIWITIFIHGTQPNWAIPYAINICYCPEGITHTKNISSTRHYYTNLLRKLSAQDSQRFPSEHMYVAGWSGRLSPQVRKDTAKIYYTELHTISKELSANHTAPIKIRIISHSHGGNVALNMAHFYTDEAPLIIDELVLLGCPVQKETSELTQHPMFQRVYSIYSPSDWIQILDPQGYTGITHLFTPNDRPFFSERVFKDHHNLIQIKLCRAWIGIWHIEFMMPHVIEKLPSILAQEHTQTHQTSEKCYAVTL